MTKQGALLIVIATVALQVLLPLGAIAQSRQDAVRLHNEAGALLDRARSDDDLKRALDKYEQAVTIYQRLNEQKYAGLAFNSIGKIYEHWGQYAKAAEYYEKSRAIFRRIGDLTGEGRATGNLGNVYTDWEQYDKAVEYYEKSRIIFQKSGDLMDEGKTIGSLGNVCKARGQYQEAVEYDQRALALFQKIGDLEDEGKTIGNLGNIYSNWGQYGKAVEYYEKAIAIKRKLGDLDGEGLALGNMGNAYTGWGQYKKAVECLDKSLEIARRINNPSLQVLPLNNLGSVYQACAEYDNALKYFEQGLAVCRKIRIPADLAINNIANLYLDKGQTNRAEPFVKQARVATSLARLSLAKADWAAAKRYYEMELKRAEISRRADTLFVSYTGLGMACEGMGDYGLAADHFRKGVELTEALRSSLNKGERETFFDVRIDGFYRTAPYEGLARMQMRQKQPQEAFKTTEYTKARVFAEAMSRMSEGKVLAIPPEILKQDDSINNELAALKKNLQKAFEKKNKLVIDSLEPQVKQLEGKLQAHIKMLREKYPLFAATKYPQPMDLSQTDLKDDEWVLAYHVTDPGIIIYLTKGRKLVKGLFKPIARKEVDDLVRKFRLPMELGPEDSLPKKLATFDFKSGKKLSDLLLSDILPDLPQNTLLIIVPDGSLGVVPFEMLVLNDGGKVTTDKRPQTSGAEFFGDRNPISYYQSITALTLARTLGKQQKPGDKLLAMVDPVFSSDDPRLVKLAKQEKDKLLATLPTDLTMSIQTEKGISFPRLPLTAQLGESLKKTDPKTDLYEGMTAKKSVVVEKDLTPYRSVVFATHGYFGKDLPGIQEPVLVLSLVGEPKGKDGFLRLSEVMGLKINCDIAALTACQTGLGRHISGEGTMGMGRAFQYAGAKSVLMSLWSVSETSSVQLVESFFRHLKEGKSKLEALRLAREEIRKAGYDHPFYWAPFILVGEVN